MTPQLKQPAEVIRPTVPIASPVRLDAVTVAARGLVPGAAALIAVGTVLSGPAGGIELTLSGGSDGERYLLTIQVEDAAGQLLERELEVAVIDGAWLMPDGGAPYLSIAAFVEAITIEEALAQTDDGTGRIDRQLLTRALVAAQAEIDAHLAGRYVVPLTALPPLLETVLIDRARNRLYPRGGPEGIAAAAKDALRTLERIQSGAMQLGVPAAQAPAAPASETPVVISPGRRAYPDWLRDY